MKGLQLSGRAFNHRGTVLGAPTRQHPGSKLRWSRAAQRAEVSQPRAVSLEGEVLGALERIIDPDFNANIVECGFVKDLSIDRDAGRVAFRLELTTPACPVKGEFERQAREYVGNLDWVQNVDVKMDAQPPQPLLPEGEVSNGLKKVANVIAVYSCKGGVGKSTVAVNLAYTLAQMGARVGIFDADIYGPSLPTMVDPELRVLQMDPETRAIKPTLYEGVKLVSFGFAGQGSAIMRGPMVSGLVRQLLTDSEWGDLDYLVIDFPPGTGDIQLTLCQSVALSAAVIVTTPQKLAFIDVAKGIRMFARLMVPCVAVVENMSYFEADGKRHLPFGKGSGERIVKDFGLGNLVRFPIVPDLSLASDDGRPLVVDDPTCEVSRAFTELGAAVVREVAKLRKLPKNTVRYDKELRAFVVRLPGDLEEEFLLDPALVRRNDTSAKSVNEWTGEKMLRDSDIPDDIEPQSVNPLGNYAVQILWHDNFNQVAAFDLLAGLERLDPNARKKEATALSEQHNGNGTNAQRLMATAKGAMQ